MPVGAPDVEGGEGNPESAEIVDNDKRGNDVDVDNPDDWPSGWDTADSALRLIALPFHQAEFSIPTSPLPRPPVDKSATALVPTPPRAPFAPGGPSSPIENAFVRLSVAPLQLIHER